jgi:hypothetical protein
MKKSATVCLAVCAMAATALTISGQDSRPRGQFRFERPVVSMGGPQRLRVDIPLLVGSQPPEPAPERGFGPEQSPLRYAAALNDLRLYDASGREVPYLVVLPAPPGADWVQGHIAATPATEKTSGFETDFEDLTTIDRVSLTGLSAPFMKRANLEGSGDRTRWTVLLNQTTVFDLPDSQLRQLELAFTPGSYRYVRVTWDDSNSAKMPLPAAVAARKVAREQIPLPPLTAPIAFEQRPSEPSKSRYRLRLPGAHLPIVAFDLDVGGGYVFRRASVTESRLTSGKLVPAAIGETTLRRVVQGDLAATALRLPVGAPAEPDVDLTIDDGNNLPLELKGITAIFAELPWIYFEGDGGAIVARYGDAGLQAPKYDLDAARPSIRIENVPDAAWGNARVLEPSEAVVVTGAMPTGGAPIDMTLFRYVRSILAGEAGLMAVPLDAAALAHSSGPRTDFADVRVIDMNGRQVPYVLERRDEPHAVDLQIEQRDAPKAALSSSPSEVTSYYRVRLPFANLPSARLVLTTTARVFDRTVGVSVERPADQRHRDVWLSPVASARWGHADRQTPAPSLTLQLSSTDQMDLLIAIREGDNSRLPLTAARLLLPSYRVRLFRDGSAMRMAYGRDDLGPPRYDLALRAPQVLGVTAREVSLSSEESGQAGQTNPAVAALMSPRLFWGVLVVAVVVLLALLVRLLKREQPTGTA